MICLRSDGLAKYRFEAKVSFLRCVTLKAFVLLMMQENEEYTLLNKHARTIKNIFVE